MAEKIIWAPWRSAFILSKKEKGCIFCRRFRARDSVKNLIVHRGESAFVIMNKFPYNTGHLLVVPVRHVSHLERLSEEESCEFFELTRLSVRVIKNVLRPTSLNIGMNLGRGSGAGVPGHLHMHIVPRWIGDTNFMPVIGKTNVVSVPLEPVYDRLRQEFARS
ncbi:MAG: HIT domain-containing protein [Candidatus Zixiibacteriota bacterium]